MNSGEEMDPYKLLEVEPNATEKEINRAYRKRALKVHPDRNPNDPKAAEKFDQLTIAKELLLDPARRAALDQKRKAAEEKQRRFEQMDGKRRKLQEDLERREKEAEERAKRDLTHGPGAVARMREENRELLKRASERQAEKQSAMREELRRQQDDIDQRKVRITWKSSVPITELHRMLKPFNVEAIDSEAAGVVALFPSREQALSATLHVKRDKTLGLKANMIAAAKKAPAFSSDEDAMSALRRVSQKKTDEPAPMSSNPFTPEEMARLRKAAIEQLDASASDDSESEETVAHKAKAAQKSQQAAAQGDDLMAALWAAAAKQKI